MKQTEIGLIPDDWEVKTLNDIGKFIGGGTPNTNNANYWKGNIPWISSSDISKDSINTLIPTRFITKEAVSCSATKLCPKNTILIVSRVSVGKLAISNTEVCTSQDFTNLVCNENVDENFIAYQLLPKLQHKASEAQGTSIKGITTDEVRELQIPIPPLAEQQRIAKALSDVDALISTTEKLIQKKKNIKQGTMQNLLTGKKRLPGFGPQTKSPTYKQTELGLIPDDWEVKSLGEMVKIGHGRDYKNLKSGDVPVYGTGGYMTSVNGFLYEGETVCIGRKGTIDKPQYHSGKIWTVDTLFYTYDFKSLNPKYLFSKFCLIDWLSMNEASGVPSLTAKNIEDILIAIPTEEEQTAIANVLSSMAKEIETLNTKLEKYRNLKTAMMQQLLTGKIRLV